MGDNEKIFLELYEAEKKAWDSLGRYKFMMFGYWAAVWVHLNRIAGVRRPNPWKSLVLMARNKKTQGQKSTSSSGEIKGASANLIVFDDPLEPLGDK